MHIDKCFEEQKNLLLTTKSESEYSSEYESLISENTQLINSNINDKITSVLEEIKNQSISCNNKVIDEVKKTKDIIYKAYYVQNEIAKEQEHISFFKRLFCFK